MLRVERMSLRLIEKSNRMLSDSGRNSRLGESGNWFVIRVVVSRIVSWMRKLNFVDLIVVRGKILWGI